MTEYECMRKTLSALICAVTALCAAGSLEAKTTTHRTTNNSAEKATSSSPYLQCVTFARQFTGMQIFGDAWTWWEKATGKYDEGQTPKPGAVLVFKSQGKMKLGHVAVVSQIVTDRYIQITHANWSPVNGRRGRVEDHVNVLDVSDKGDWSKVKVWYGPLNDLGTTIYTTYGFIYSANQTSAQPAKIEAPARKAIDRAPMQVAIAQAELPVDLRQALTPTNANTGVRPVTVSARISGTSARDLVAKLDANVEAARNASKDIDLHNVRGSAQ